jgi:hypothetical protein
MNQESPKKNKDIQDQAKKNRGTEHQGTKEKFWFDENQDKLFKIGKHKGENWAEIVAFHLATLLGISFAKYEPGSLPEESPTKYGVISQSFINKKDGERLINANEFLAQLIKNYDPDNTHQYADYTNQLPLIPLSKTQLLCAYLWFSVLDFPLFRDNLHLP